MFLLTSDGVHDHIVNIELEEIILNNKPEDVCNLLIKKATENGSSDDKTVVLVIAN